MQNLRAIVGTVLVGLLLNGGAWDSRCQAAGARMDIDCGRSAGEISPYIFGVTGGPYSDPTGLGVCKQVGIKLIEVLYEFSPIPMGAILTEPPPGIEPGRGIPPQPGGWRPGPAPQLRPPHDPSRPNSQEEALRQVEECLKINLEVMPSLVITAPPLDSQAFQSHVTSFVQALQRIAGRHNRTIRFYRFGNEPESPRYWQGSRQQFMETFELWVRAVKAAEPQAVIVAPGFEKPTDPGFMAVSGFIKEFLAYCQGKSLPLDILAIHGYGMDPYTYFGLPAKLMSEYLLKFPHLSPVYGTPRLANNEWNFPTPFPHGYEPLFDTAWMAAHNIAALIQMVDNGVYMTVRFGGCTLKPSIGPGPEAREADFLLVHQGYRKKPLYYAFEGFTRFADYPQRVSSTSPNKNFEVLAGFSPKKDKLYVTVCHFPVYRLLEMGKPKHGGHLRPPPFVDEKTRDKSETDQCDVTIKNLPVNWAGKAKVQRYRVDDTSQGRVVAAQTVPIQSRSITLNWQSPTPGVDFLLVEPLK